MAAVAIVNALDSIGLSIPGMGIRWPNDIEVRGRKLAGILPERIESSGGHFILIGIGINVLTRVESAPPEIERMATSLSILQDENLGPSLLPGLLTALLIHIEKALPRLAMDDLDLARSWDELNILRGQTVRVLLGANILSGKVQAIDEQGALCLHDGVQLHRISGGQVLRD